MSVNLRIGYGVHRTQPFGAIKMVIQRNYFAMTKRTGKRTPGQIKKAQEIIDRLLGFDLLECPVKADLKEQSA